MPFKYLDEKPATTSKFKYLDEQSTNRLSEMPDGKPSRLLSENISITQGKPDLLESLAGPAPTNPALKRIAEKGRELLTVPAHYINQLGFNIPRSITSSMGYDYPVRTENPAINVAANIAGGAGALKSPIAKAGGKLYDIAKNLPRGFKTIGKAAAGAITGAAYAPNEDIVGVNQRIEQAKYGAAIPIAGTIAGKGIQTVKNIVSPEAVKALTKAIKPGKWNKNFATDAAIALPIIKETKTPVKNINDFVSATKIAKKKVWDSIDSNLQLAGAKPDNLINGDTIATKIISSIPEDSVLLSPEVANTSKKVAKNYIGKQIRIMEAEDKLQRINSQLTGYYNASAKGFYKQSMDTKIASLVTEGNILRETLYNKIESLTGTNIAPLKKQYGALMNVQNEALGRLNVALRQNPMSLQEQIHYVLGVMKAASGDPKGLLQIAGSALVKRINSPDYLIRKALENTGKAPIAPKIADAIPNLYQRFNQKGGSTPPPNAPGTSTPPIIPPYLLKSRKAK